MKVIEWVLSLFKWPEIEPPTTISPAGIALIKHYEGCRLVAYKDPVGVWTIGYGHTGPDVVQGLTITQDQAEQLLRIRLSAEFVPGVLGAIAGAKQSELDAMVSLAYNIGVSAFSKSTLVRKFNAGDIKGAGDEFMRWTKAGGKSLKGLRKRRAAERALFHGATVEAAIKVGDNTP